MQKESNVFCNPVQQTPARMASKTESLGPRESLEPLEPLECPMCEFAVLPCDDYVLRLHFEQAHTTDSPFIIQDDPEPPLPQYKHVADTPSSVDRNSLVQCPEPDCGESVCLSDFNDHLEYHNAESLSFDEATGKYHSHHSSTTMHSLATGHRPHIISSGPAQTDHDATIESLNNLQKSSSHARRSKRHTHRERSNTSSSEKSIISRSISTFNPFTKPDKTVKLPNKSARLGKSELGPYAWEERMPKWLYDQLDSGPKISIINRIGRDGRLLKQEQVKNETPGIIPILAQLSALDRTVKKAYYCHPSAIHIGKTPREGGFCGYRNIQMLLSYIQGAKAQGHEEFPGRTPGVLKLQNHIEDAWDKGINEIGRVQTGGIRGTRKYIGTPEAQAFFLSSEINCAVEQFADNKERGDGAHEKLLLAIERYFARAAISDGSNVYKTLLPPIYLQQPGHSTTIVGFERRRDGSSNLVVFDPMYSTSPAMHKLIGRKNIKTARPEVLHAYRRGSGQLKKHAAFEILMLTATPPLFPAWDVLRQFPDCRFVYAFFRSRTLGYDVYPEDYFLQNFPWQQYGGLWSCDEARFARGGAVNVLLAQALRRITSDGSSTKSSSSITSPISPLIHMSFQHYPAADTHMSSKLNEKAPSVTPSVHEFKGSFVSTAEFPGTGPVFGMGGFQDALLQPKAIRPTLSLLTDVGRKYPGFPTPLSPTLHAKELFPSPASEIDTVASTPDNATRAMLLASPKIVDGPLRSSSAFRHQECGDDLNVSPIGLIDSVLACNQNSQLCHSKWHAPSPPSAPSSSSWSMMVPRSPTSPSRCISPRTAMLKTMVNKQFCHNVPHGHTTHPGSKCLHNSWSTHTHPPDPSIHIANGTETNTLSPIDPQGTMLLYTSNRSVDSGLLGVRPLSEEQVAEYRFWRPCARRMCAFGCSGAQEGEWAAAKRLFRTAEVVEEVVDARAQEDRAGRSGRVSMGLGYNGQSDGKEESIASGQEYGSASSWAGRRMVKDWNSFLRSCEREGVARF